MSPPILTGRSTAALLARLLKARGVDRVVGQCGRRVMPPRAQENQGALQDMPHTEFVRPLTRYASTVGEPELVAQGLDEALARCLGQGGEPGPVHLGFPADSCASPNTAPSCATTAAAHRDQ